MAVGIAVLPLLKPLLERHLKAPFIPCSEMQADNAAVFKTNHAASPRLHRSARSSRTALPGAVAAAAAAVWWLLAGANPAQASDKKDHDRARSAVQAGTVLPLPALLEKLQRSHPGQVLELELEHVDGRWLYEVKMLHNNGQLLKIKLDAGTGAVLQVKQRGAPRDSEKSNEKSKEKSGESIKNKTPSPAPAAKK